MRQQYEIVYLAGGCLWGVQHFVRTLPGVIATEAGRANGTATALDGPYDGYAECVKTTFDPAKISISQLMEFLFEIIDPYSVDKQGVDVGHKYRTGLYSMTESHLREASAFIAARSDCDQIKVEVAPLTHYIPSAPEHQDRLLRCPEDYSYCHIPLETMNKYRGRAD